MEKKTLHQDSMLSIRAAPAGDAGAEIEGYAAVWDRLDVYGDVIRRGAFLRTLERRERPVRMRWQHFGPVIGRWIELREDDVGLYVRGRLIKGHSLAEDVAAAVRDGAVDGLSIGFYARDWEQSGDTRVLKEIDLVEISVVEEPAQLAATISEVRAASRPDELEAALVRYGVPAEVVRLVVRRAYEAGAVDMAMWRLSRGSR